MFIKVEDADFQQVVAAWNQGFSDYLLPIQVGQEALEKRIQSLALSKSLSVVFSIDGTFAGVILLGVQTFQQNKVMWVGGMAVVPEYRRHKVASKLLDYAENLAREQQCAYLILEVLAENHRARKLYETQGFQAINELAVGTVQISNTDDETSDCVFQSVESVEQVLTENQWTPWQNRGIFSDKNVSIYQNGMKLGSISFNLAEAATGKELIIKQLHVLKSENMDKINTILRELKKREGAESVKLTNFEMETPEYVALEKMGVALQVTQFQLAKKIEARL